MGRLRRRYGSDVLIVWVLTLQQLVVVAAVAVAVAAAAVAAAAAAVAGPAAAAPPAPAPGLPASPPPPVVVAASSVEAAVVVPELATTERQAFPVARAAEAEPKAPAPLGVLPAQTQTELSGPK